MSSYAWIIEKDHIASEGEPEGTNGNAVGKAGPREATDEQVDLARKGRAFRIYDDDGELYYSGRIWTEEEGTDDDFGPLWDFGEPDAGATDIKYYEDGKWVLL